LIEAHAAQLDAYGQRSYKARPSKRSSNRMRFARAMDGRCRLVAVGAGSKAPAGKSHGRPDVPPSRLFWWEGERGEGLRL
jgi:hypothetical protein